MNTTGFEYAGGELEAFAAAANWKRHFATTIRPFVSGRVLEVGAGIGGTTHVLWNQGVESWLCLEPDTRLRGDLDERIAAGQLPSSVTAQGDSLRDLPRDARFDTILYIDVLEHIEDDATELHEAAARLSSSGSLVVLAPAYRWLFSRFDEAIGHYRRYSRRSLLELTPDGLVSRRARYLDSVGVLASLANRALLRSPMPSPRQIQFWDRCMIPCSRALDVVTGYSFGKSVIVVWLRPS